MEQQGSNNRYLSTLDGAAKSLVVLALLLYSIGILITNVYFQRYGLVSFSLVKARYITTGLLWAFLVTATFLLNSLYHHLFAGKSKLARILWVSTILLVAFVIIGVVSLRYGEAATLPLLAMLFMFAPLYLTVSMSRSVFRSIGQYRFADDKQRGVRADARLNAVLSSLLVLFSIVLFAMTGYPFLSQSVGGGQLFLIDLQIKPDRRAGLQSLGLTISKEGKLSAAKLLSDETDSLIITTNEPLDTHPRAYRIPKDAVDAAVLYDSK